MNNKRKWPLANFRVLFCFLWKSLKKRKAQKSNDQSLWYKISSGAVIYSLRDSHGWYLLHMQQFLLSSLFFFFFFFHHSYTNRQISVTVSSHSVFLMSKQGWAWVLLCFYLFWLMCHIYLYIFVMANERRY